MTHQAATPWPHAQPAQGIDAAMIRRSLLIAVTVGTILNIIASYDVLLAGNWPSAFKAVLTYMVPFIVATYGALSSTRQAAREFDRRRSTLEPMRRQETVQAAFAAPQAVPAMDPSCVSALVSAKDMAGEILANAQRVNEASKVRAASAAEVADLARHVAAEAETIRTAAEASDSRLRAARQRADTVARDIEPHRVSRRLVWLSHAAMAASSAWV